MTLDKVEPKIAKFGGKHSKGEDWKSYAVSDGNLITGQNPASSEAGAKAVLQQLSPNYSRNKAS